MTRQVCTVNQITRTAAGVALTTHAGANGDGYSFMNDGKTIVECVSTSESTEDLVFTHPGEVDDLGVADLTVTVAIGGTRYMGPFPLSFNQVGSDAGKVFFTCADASTTIAVIRR